MKIAIWNVNSIKARLPIVTGWLQQNQPDILMMQEIKCVSEAFPAAEFDTLGYRQLVAGQKTYNGVAILSKEPAKLVMDTLPGDKDDPQARYMEAEYNGITAINIYLPNGNPVDTEKFPYKHKWMRRLHARLAALLAEEKPFLVGGDFNVIPEARDVYDAKAWEGDALFHIKTRELWRGITNLGLTDAYRALHPAQDRAFTFWDYQAGAWQRDNGLRIDHFLLSPEIIDRLQSCVIDRAPRGMEKASDHTPVMLSIN
ncbi:MAG: exodeoxyribonuclease III [Alphaproteobacteria bacterium]|nr:exodeoxyribonuclease III [Alphaproteobacteria bacterium]